MHELNLPYYAFLADTTGEFAAFSMVSTSASSRKRPFQGQPVRRVTFSVESTNSVYQLILRQNPILGSVEQGDEPPRRVGKECR